MVLYIDKDFTHYCKILYTVHDITVSQHNATQTIKNMNPRFIWFCFMWNDFFHNDADPRFWLVNDNFIWWSSWLKLRQSKLQKTMMS